MNRIDQALSGGVDAESNLLSTLTQLGIQHLLQQALEQEQQDYLGRGRYERGDEKAAAERPYRNGYLCMADSLQPKAR